MRLALLIYFLGVGLALWRTDGSAITKVVYATLWPLGAVAFVVTITLMFLVTLVAFPAFGAGVAVTAALIWMLTAR